MKNRFIITKNHNDRPVFLCWGGGKFSWWTPHLSAASKLIEKDAERLWERSGGTIKSIDQINL